MKRKRRTKKEVTKLLKQVTEYTEKGLKTKDILALTGLKTRQHLNHYKKLST